MYKPVGLYSGGLTEGILHLSLGGGGFTCAFYGTLYSPNFSSFAVELFFS